MFPSSRPRALLGDWATAGKRIALIGDSTLDNVLWVGDEPSIPEQIAASIPNSAVVNLAADGFTTADTLQGSRRVISVGMRGRAGQNGGCDPIQFDDDDVFRPLSRVAALNPPPTHIVLSVGGNDVREILNDMRRLPDIIRDFMPNYLRIVQACLKITPDTVLMMQYRPSFNMDGGGYGVYQAIGSLPGNGDSVEKLNRLMETIYEPVLAFAQEKKLPLVDLPRTFDIHEDKLYSHQIEPSAEGGKVITNMLSHIFQHDDAEKPSTLYTYLPCIPGRGEVKEEVTGQKPWIIPHEGVASTIESGTDHAKISALVGMGFERGPVEAALARNFGDQGRAVADLLGDR